jgi:signal transduction histidine kinase
MKDTGTRRDPRRADRIFDPIFTTKPAGMDTRFSICRSIIHAHEGSSWASPRTPRGTVLQFTVPGYSKVESNGSA